MNSFAPGFIEAQTISPQLLRTIRLLGEHKGRQEMFQKQSPQVLKTLREASIIQSAESSNRLEGVVAPPGRIRALVNQKTTPRNRSEQEIAGYRDVLATIHLHHEGIPFTPGLVLQFHRDLFRFAPVEGGRWKVADNDIIERLPDGTERVRFKPLPAHRTPEAMNALHDRFEAAWSVGLVDPLLLIPAYVLDFLCIHPFLDGNGRMARLLTLLLLYRAGFEAGRYISLEQVVEQNKDGYYDTLHQASQGWHEGRHVLASWTEYFLGVVLLSAYREMESRTGELTAAKGAKQEAVLAALDRLPGEFQMAALEKACPGVSHATIRRVLAGLKKQGRVRCLRPGRDAVWSKA
jgi:Fic family protein